MSPSPFFDNTQISLAVVSVLAGIVCIASTIAFLDLPLVKADTVAPIASQQ